MPIIHYATFALFGIRVDVSALAEGLWDLFTDAERKMATQYGMLPARLMDSINRMLGEKFDHEGLRRMLGKSASDSLHVQGGEIVQARETLKRFGVEVDAGKRREFVAGASKAIAVELLGHAKAGYVDHDGKWYQSYCLAAREISR